MLKGQPLHLTKRLLRPVFREVLLLLGIITILAVQDDKSWATANVVRYPSGTPVQVCTPSDPNTNCGGTPVTPTLDQVLAAGSTSASHNITLTNGMITAFQAKINDTHNNIFLNGADNSGITSANNVVIGNSSGGSIATGGGGNVVIGAGAFEHSDGTDNFALGGSTLYFLSSGNYNIGIGNSSGLYDAGANHVVTANLDTFIGDNSGPLATGDTNETVICSDSVGCFGNGSNTMTFGNSSVTDNYFNGNVEIPSTVFFYIGNATTDGSWRFHIDSTSGNLFFECRISGTWTYEGSFNK